MLRWGISVGIDVSSEIWILRYIILQLMKDKWPLAKQVCLCAASRLISGVPGGFTLRLIFSDGQGFG